MNILAGLSVVVWIVFAWVVFGWIHDYTMGYPPWFKKSKKK